jgi:polysaccharide pyruvyl transferase WcaK-like protein
MILKLKIMMFCLKHTGNPLLNSNVLLKSEMKIGILTFHRCINYGSYWQTRCLYEKLTSLGHDIEILDHRSIRTDLAEWRCALKPVLPTPVPDSDIPLYRKKIEKFFNAFRSYRLSEAFNLDTPPSLDKFDLIIVGSDEVWNLSHPWFGGHSIFFGSEIKTCKLISYAASFGNFDSTNKLDASWASMLSKFESISVRDYNSSEIIKNTLGFEPEIVLDPCLLYPLSSEKVAIYNNKYLAVYGHNFSPQFARNLRSWADKKRIKLISIGYRNDWVHQNWIDAGPIEFMSFIEQSEAVITNFFHGCIFSFIFSKPFICNTTPYRTHKIRDLMRLTGSMNRLATDEISEISVNSLLTLPPETSVINTISDLRTKSNGYLKQSLLVNIASY